MSLTRLKANGRGRLQARLVIEGLQAEFVSAKRMEKTTSDGRDRVCGLDHDGLRIGYRADMMRARLTGDTLNVAIRDIGRIAGKAHGRVTRALTRRPTARAYLAADLAVADTTATLRDTTALASSGVVHINTECIAYTGKTSTTLTGLTRGRWQTKAQAHYVADGEGLLDALVTDQPVSLDGRRAYLYLYGDGDDPSGDGNLRWRGIVSSDVSWSGGTCSLTIDPISRLLEQPIGGDLGGSVGLRGIKYTSTSPFVVTVILYPSGLEEVRATAEVCGFWETQSEFCDAINTQIAYAMSAAGITLDADARLALEPRSDTIDVVYVTGTTTQENIAVLVHDDIVSPSPIAETTSPADWYNDTGGIETRMGDRSWSPPANTRYKVTISAPVPRGTLGRRTYFDPYRTRSGGSLGLTASEYLLPLAGTVIPTTGSVLMPQGMSEDDEPRPMPVTSVSGRDVYVDPGGIPSGWMVYGKTASFVLGRYVASGSVVDLISQLETDSPGLANTGAMPLIVVGDIDADSDVQAAIDAQPLAQNRGFYAFEEPVTLGEFVEPELLTAGLYQRVGVTGAIEWARVGPALTTDETAYTIDDSAQSSTIQRAPDGILGHIVYRMGYDPRAGEWDDRTVTFRDVQATSPTRTPVSVEIAQRSTSSRTWKSSDDWNTIDRSALMRVAMASFGVFGTPISVVTVEADARYMEARIGDVVSLSSSTLPNPSDGRSAVTAMTGIVIGHSLELSSGRVSLSLQVNDQRYAGYNIGLPISMEDPPVNTSGNTWQLTVGLGGYTFATTVASLLEAGELIHLTRGDALGLITVPGVVDSIDSATSVTVTLSSAWDDDGDEWYLRARGAAEYASTDLRTEYAFVAGPDGKIGFSDGDQESQVFA